MINVQIGVLFGYGSTSVGCIKAKDSNDYYVVIRPTIKTFNVGDILSNDDVNYNNEFILVFPTEKQMLSVMAALTNKTFEEIKIKWIEKQKLQTNS